jgi:glycosyltransferase involved in cell wall biosynthesis
MATPSHPYGLVLDIQAAQDRLLPGRGIGRYVVQHAQALLAIPGLVRALSLNPRLPFPGALPADLLASPLLDWGTATTFRRARRDGAVAYHVMSPFDPVMSPPGTVPPAHTVRPDVPLITTLYDLIRITYPEVYLAKRHEVALHRARLELVRRSDLVLAISAFTRREALRLLDLDPDRVVNVGTGVSPLFRPPGYGDDPAVHVRASLPSLDRPFVLTVSDVLDRKNTDGLIDAFARLPRHLRESHRLVVVCRLSPPFEQKWRAHAKRAGLADDELILTDEIPDRLLRALYQAAALFVFPSFSEGFGLPVAEAIACGCPTITSNATAVPDIMDWPPSTFDPTDPDAIAAAIERGLDDPAFRNELRAAGRARAQEHTWAAVAARTADALGRLPPPVARPRRGRTGRTRLALVGPLPPAESPMAVYNGRLATALAQRCELDLFTMGDEGGRWQHRIAGARTFSARLLGARLHPTAYDAVLYAVELGQDYRQIQDLARRWPGIVWLHDPPLDGLGSGTVRDGRSEDSGGSVAAKLREQDGGRRPVHPPKALVGAAANGGAVDGTAGLVRGARAVLVDTRFAAHLLRLDQGPDAPLPPVWRLPFAVPTPRPPEEPVVRDDPPLIAAFGPVPGAKTTDLLIEAFALVRSRVPARLALVGIALPEYRREMRARARSAGLAADVEIAGGATSEAYHRWRLRATCAVQLGPWPRCETSTAVADCLTVGLPTVTNMIGADGEYPPDAVVALAPNGSAEELADRLTELLTRREVWQRHHEAALAHAHAGTFARLATELLAVVERVDGGAPPV